MNSFFTGIIMVGENVQLPSFCLFNSFSAFQQRATLSSINSRKFIINLVLCWPYQASSGWPPDSDKIMLSISDILSRPLLPRSLILFMWVRDFTSSSYFPKLSFIVIIWLYSLKIIPSSDSYIQGLNCQFVLGKSERRGLVNLTKLVHCLAILL